MSHILNEVLGRELTKPVEVLFMDTLDGIKMNEPMIKPSIVSFGPRGVVSDDIVPEGLKGCILIKTNDFITLIGPEDNGDGVIGVEDEELVSKEYIKPFKDISSSNMWKSIEEYISLLNKDAEQKLDINFGPNTRIVVIKGENPDVIRQSEMWIDEYDTPLVISRVK